ncbi:AAA family ATPase [Brachyspira alvinipulli]|uniref:AAA family ATPase n=1 Tax=Brachyspira alvinipulli TaxID=84379 RepID=UPI000481422D|nr:AAA family ATPase [Brachyspira alvinipulli]
MSEKIRKYPTLYVKNFAKIKEAEVELAPFTLFVGDNNSGKSYLMTLIYGLIQYTNKVIDIIFKDEKTLEELEEYKKTKDIIDNYIETLDFDKSENMSIEEIKNFIDLFNALLNKYSNNVVNYIFNSSNEIILEYIECKLNYDKFLFKKVKSKNIRDDIEISFIGIRKGGIERGVGYTKDKVRYREIIKNMVDFIINSYFQIQYELSKTNKIFLPVSRTGFLLTKSDIASSAIIDKYDRYTEEKNNQYLSRPVIDFLNHLNYLSKQNNKIEHMTKKLYFMINFFEENLISGQININSETGNIYYQPKNMNTEFQMYLSSAVITELAPLYLFLKYGLIKYRLLMEEPEISLHPYLQQQLTRVFIKLINSHIHILITTHSDTIIQHINNMIKLNANSEDKRKELMQIYNYDEDDLISEDKVKMYQFDIEKDGFTKVTELEGSKYGFEVPTFHDYLIKVSKEFDDFIEKLDN